MTSRVKEQFWMTTEKCGKLLILPESAHNFRIQLAYSTQLTMSLVLLYGCYSYSFANNGGGIHTT